MSLSGKIVLITGGTGALGSVVTQRMVREQASVGISFRNEQELSGLPRETKESVTALKADVTNEESVQKLFEAIILKHKRIDILINTVGGFVPSKHLAEISLQEWELMMNLNLKSSFLCTREALRSMKGQAYGRIVNISAMAGIFPTPGRAAYAVSKAGVSLMTDIVGKENKGTGITINAIAPSIIATQANKASMPNEDFAKWVTPESIADIICYLCSEPAGSITGTTIKASAGL